MAKKSTTGTRRQTSGRTGRSGEVGARKSTKKHVGDVLGISRARVPSNVPRATADRGGNPKGVEAGRRRGTQRLARTVGGVRGRGR